MTAIRQPIVATLGHVDHGKTTLLDSIRNTKVQSKEAGSITQAIGASEVPIGIVTAVCKPCLSRMPVKLTIPGLLFIDTPGHEVFSNLRKRGGSIADIAILVIDVAKGVEAQTAEAIGILKTHKTPFVIALNKIDALSGWIPHKDAPFSQTIEEQRREVAEQLDTKTYELIGQLYNYGFQAERFDRVSDFTKQIVIVPVSARTREGLPELLLFVAGLAQKFLENTLKTSSDAPGKASVLEVREEKGLGMTLDAILYDGSIKQGDKIFFPLVEGGVAESKVKAIFRPKPLDEMRDPTEKFSPIKYAEAAAGIKISCEDAGHALAGGSLFVARTPEGEQIARDAIAGEVREIVFEGEKDGVIIKADSLGSLEALTKLFEAEKIPVRAAGIGAVSRKEILEASSVKANNRFLGVVFAFNVPVPADVALLAEEECVKVFSEKVIYNLVDGYGRWVDAAKATDKKDAFAKLVLPAKIVLMKNHCFRVSKPCIVGVEILSGVLRTGVTLIKSDGSVVGQVKGIQHDKESVAEARQGQQVAVSIDGPVFGRGLDYGEELLVDVPKESQLLLQGRYAATLSPDQQDLLKDVMRAKGLKVF
ncbi:translation initiation factor IF-2 [Candidatus Micrarchaeota archaeon CG1_02_55_22]|nr:MAG: translation initiation factor IF-2 [Candidatus Micrarchaeota archaeon CG1_02_55_22]